MMTKSVSPATVKDAKALLGAASSEAIEETLSRMRPRFRQYDRWLTARHPYRDIIKVLKPKIIRSVGMDGSKLAEYIAASIPLHVVDGWVFLARAFDSMRSGDRNTAVHLGYYAELRAAMSLLASEGVGVFSNLHVAIGSACAPTIWKKAPGTHAVTWQLLDSWAVDRDRVTTLLTAIQVESLTINEWFDEARLPKPTRPVLARQWLKSWSIDLKYFPVDKDLRNHTSYRPSGILPGTPQPMDVSEEMIDPILRTWDALEPSLDPGGAAIDRVLLLRALALAHMHSKGSQGTWENLVKQLVEDKVASAMLGEYLMDPRMKEHDLLTWASNSSKRPPVQAVLSRATLLLRVANGVCSRRLSNAGVKKEELRFWWTRFGEGGGLWSDVADLDSFADLWAEVSYAIEDTEGELVSRNVPNTISRVSQIFGREIALTQFSRVPLWLLGVD